MSYKGIIFDLDGVICSTDEYHYLAWKALADRLKIPFDRQDNNRLRGVSRMESLNIILEKSKKLYCELEKTILSEEKNEIYRQFLHQMKAADLTTEVSETLNVLRKAGLKLAIGSSSKNAPLILERLELGDFFDAVVDGNSITYSKPDPEVFLKAAEKLNLSPSECLVVEDAHAGVEAAIKGGFDCAGLADASQNDQVTWRLKSFSDLQGIGTK